MVNRSRYIVLFVLPNVTMLFTSLQHLAS